MRVSSNWIDYELIDCSGSERLERWGDIILIRPDPQIIWNTKRENPLWRQAHARYPRSNSGGGQWQVFKKIPDSWSVKYHDLVFNVKPMGFKHTGIFPEQAVNWSLMQNLIKKSDRKVKVLNLFAYTGGATLACLKAGAAVTHVDASKGMVACAKENLASSGLADAPVRYSVDDCRKFVEREIRRGNKYDGIIMDPPSYGRGPGGEVWRLEDNIWDFVELTSRVLSDDPLFVIINSYTTGLAPSVLTYMMETLISKKYGGHTVSDELGLPATDSGLVLPCGAAGRWTSR